jgi:chemotaxis protein MotB
MKSRAFPIARRVLISLSVMLAMGVIALGCGYSEEEWKAQLDKYNRLVAQNQETEGKLAEVNKQLEASRNRVAALEGELEALGVDVSKLNQDLASRSTELSKLSATLEEQQKALAEYKRRAAALERIKQRFERLRQKLHQLVDLGLSVKIRNNRMIISLPGDVLFESAKTKLKKEGKEVLDKVAGIINGDASLRNRYYQVAGHTDNVELKGGLLIDNWGLSLMRAREVLVYLIDPAKGSLPATRWSAAGFADTDPVASNKTEDGKQLNRRCEIIVVPSAEEMLDLKEIAE